MPLSSHAPPARNPHAKSWMLFVDGENFTLRGQDYALDPANGIHHHVHESQWYEPDTFLWMPNLPATTPFQKQLVGELQDRAVRAYYYTTTDQSRVADARLALWQLGFQPEVFVKNRQGRSKGVDLTLAKDLLANAFMANYEVAVLVAGDGDYVPLVDEVKRLGRIVIVSFFTGTSSGLSDRLKLASDTFFDVGPVFKRSWAQAGVPGDAKLVQSKAPPSPRHVMPKNPPQTDQ